MKTKEFLISWLIEIAFGIAIFSLIRWLGTDNNWLAFFITWAISNSTLRFTKKELLEKLLPVFNQVDENINNLHDKTTMLEEDVEELKTKVSDLEGRIDDIQK